MPRLLISMIKNEEDVIERFVRHHAPQFDAIHILDDGSTDGTLAILKELCAEFPALHVSASTRRGHFQSDKTTELYHAAASELVDGTLVAVLDADEFLDPAIWSLDLSKHRYIAVPRINYVAPLVGFEPSQKLFGMEHAQARIMRPKVVFVHAARTAARLRILDGNHAITVDGRQVAPEELPAYICHYPYRSKEQFVKKVVMGWLAVLLTGRETGHTGKPVSTHWKRAFEEMRAADYAPDDGEFVRSAYGAKNVAAFRQGLVRKSGLVDPGAVHDRLRRTPSLTRMVIDDYEATLRALATPSQPKTRAWASQVLGKLRRLSSGNRPR